MFNLQVEVIRNPVRCKQLSAGETLITMYNCPLTDKRADLWSHNNYIFYVAEGRKIWHTSQGSYDLKKGSCVFVRKGASIVEQFFDAVFCFVLFFVPDEFICEVLKSKSTPIYPSSKTFNPVIAINHTAVVQSFFQSIIPYFDANPKPDQSLLELKFRELILALADDPSNVELRSYFSSLLQEPQSVSLQRVMEENFCFNLKLEEFAKISSRSLSAFKRDFERIYHMTPGKWLTEKRLDYAKHLLTNLGRTVTETAFESGFENPSHFSRAFRQRFGTSPATLKQHAAV